MTTSSNFLRASFSMSRPFARTSSTFLVTFLYGPSKYSLPFSRFFTTYFSLYSLKVSLPFSMFLAKYFSLYSLIVSLPVLDNHQSLIYLKLIPKSLQVQILFEFMGPSMFLILCRINIVQQQKR